MKSSKQHVFLNGKIFTSDRSMPQAEAMIVEDSRIIWIGPQNELPSAGSFPLVTDLKGFLFLHFFLRYGDRKSTRLNSSHT